MTSEQDFLIKKVSGPCWKNDFLIIYQQSEFGKINPDC